MHLGHPRVGSDSQFRKRAKNISSGFRVSVYIVQVHIRKVLAVEAEFVGVFDIFSKRQKKLRGEVPDVYTYDSIPVPLRVQIIHIWNDTLGSQQDCADSLGPRRTYRLIVETLCRKYGVFLSRRQGSLW